MLRVACLISVLAGCDAVFGLERAAVVHDEDGDGVADAEDPCPHLPAESTIDADQDGVSADCDPDDHDPETTVSFFSFDDELSPELALDGAEAPDLAGTISFGALGPGINSLVAKNVDANIVIVDLGFEILDNTIEAGGPELYAELGVYSIHRGFTADRKTRGDTCFLGRNQPGPDPVYLEPNEDDASLPSVQTSGELNGSFGRMRMDRTPTTVGCTVFRDGFGRLTTSFTPTKLQKLTGSVAISTENLRARLRYLYIATQPITLL